MSTAHVDSVQRLGDFQAALATFADRGMDALTSVSLELRRVQDWLEEQLRLWTIEVRHAEEAVFRAKSELAMRQMLSVNGRPNDCSELEKELRRATARLDHAEDKARNTKHWLRALPDAVAEYDRQSRPFQDLLEHDCVKMAAFVDRKIDQLEKYAETRMGNSQ
jgi:hypothetical protein